MGGVRTFVSKLDPKSSVRVHDHEMLEVEIPEVVVCPAAQFHRA